jgi:acetoin utilization protein AcuB
VLTISPKDNMYKARELMNQNNIRTLPVVEDNLLVGLLTDRNLKQAEASNATSLDVFELRYLLVKIEVANIMTKDPISIPCDTTLSEAAEILLEHKLDAVPVMSGKKQLEGILTSSDVKRAILTLTAIGRRGIQIGMRLSDSPGALMQILDVIHDMGARLASLITVDCFDQDHQRKAYFHIYSVNREKLMDLTAALYGKGTLLYMVDLKNGERHIFNQ